MLNFTAIPIVQKLQAEGEWSLRFSGNSPPSEYSAQGLADYACVGKNRTPRTWSDALATGQKLQLRSFYCMSCPWNYQY
jgi:hypothetical protein